MSLKTRLGLLAGSSLAAASFLALAPTAASAQTCTPTAVAVSGSSSAADVVTCSAGTFPTGITYASAGNLSVSMVANGAVVASTMTANGVNLTGNGTDTVTWDSSIGSLTGGAGTAGPVIDATSVAGAINITTAALTGTQAGTTYGILATSTGGANIVITRSTGAVSNNVAGGQAAIQAVTNGGAVNITTAGTTTGRLRGIVAQTSGTGAINLTIGGNVSANATDGISGIETTAGTGATTINITSGTVSGGAGAAIRATSGAAVAVQNAGTVSGRVDFSGITAGGVTFTGGLWTASGASVFSSQADTLTLTGSNANTLAAGATINFGDGADTFNMAARPAGSELVDVGLIAAAGTIDFGAGADVFNVTGNLISNGATFNFGSGADTFNHSGMIVWNGGTISNLEAFNNAGLIYLGGQGTPAGARLLYSSDGDPNDTFVMTSGVYAGSAGGRIVMDVDLGDHGSQIGCASPTIADCANFTGAMTAGSTMLTVKDASFRAEGGTLGAVVTLVQGSSAAENFVLDPASDFYGETSQGAAIRKPIVAYRLHYDAAGQRHVLLGAPTDEAYETATFAAAAQEVWRSTAGTWLGRQADLRAAPGELETSRGFWVRVGAQSGERDVGASYETSGLTLDYDLSHKQRITHLTFGADMLGAAGEDSAWVLGGMVGFVRSDIEFDATPTETSATGYTGGLYASWLGGPLFIDATVSLNLLHIKSDTPQAGLGLDVPMTFDAKSLGGQVEAGWRIGLDGGFFIDPLAGVSYVTTKFEDAQAPGDGGTFDFDDNYKSLRIGAGARVGRAGALMGLPASYSLAARYWDESEGGAALNIATLNGSSAVLADDFGGGFSEVTGSLNLYSEGGGVSGFINAGGKFADGYQAIDGSAGVRVRW